MSNLIPEIQLEKLAKLTYEQLVTMKSCEIYDGDRYVGVIVIPPLNGGMTITDNIKTQAEYLALRGNTVGGVMPDQLVDRPVIVNEFKVPEVEYKCEVCGKVCKSAGGLSGHSRSHS